MTLAELEADPTFARHIHVPPPARLADWITVAQGIMATTKHDLANLDHSERESRIIGLRSLDHIAARQAVIRLQELPPPRPRKS